MAAPPTRARILSLYKNLLYHGRMYSMPEMAKKTIRSEFRKNAGETDAAKLRELVAEGESKLRFLRMVTPKVRRADAYKTAEEEGAADEATSDGSATFVIRDGKLVRGSAQTGRDGQPLAKDQFLHPTDVARFHRQVAKARRLGMV
eukprot:tig00000718_g3692.t1